MPVAEEIRKRNAMNAAKAAELDRRMQDERDLGLARKVADMKDQEARVKEMIANNRRYHEAVKYNDLDLDAPTPLEPYEFEYLKSINSKEADKWRNNRYEYGR